MSRQKDTIVSVAAAVGYLGFLMAIVLTCVSLGALLLLPFLS